MKTYLLYLDIGQNSNKMNLLFNDTFKSLDNIVWKEIPMFCVITGKNGSGKTQLLQLINTAITKNWIDVEHHNRPKSLPQITGDQLRREDVVYLRHDWQLEDLGPAVLGNIQSERQGLFTSYSNHRQSIISRYGGNNTAFLQEKKNDQSFINGNLMTDIYDKLYQKEIETGIPITREDFLKQLPEKYLPSLQEQISNKNIGKTFWIYRIKMIEAQAKGISEEQFFKTNGEKPWALFNQLLQDINLPLVLNDPESLSLFDAYIPTLSHTQRNESIKFSDLSSGERVLVSLAFWLLNANEFKTFPKLLLLDEPDAHLHPSMSKQLLDVLENVLVKKYNVRVIMTTHSPSTVVLTKPESLFEMSIQEPRIKKSESKNETVSILTEGLVFIGENTKYFLVEDNDDVDFYNYVYRYLISNDIIKSDIPMVFIPASTNDKSGGKSVVEGWVNKLQFSGLSLLIQGLIDEDSGNQPATGIFKINRYSIENYLVDPIITYAALMDKDLHNAYIDIGLQVGEEYKLKTLDIATLQKIADAIIAIAQPEVRKLLNDYNSNDEQKVNIEFINSKTIEYPQWVLKRRGKTILQQAYNTAFKSAIVNYQTLFKALKKTNFIPTELAHLLDSIRKS
jgi:AAA15 family ATPase/GTPase